MVNCGNMYSFGLGQYAPGVYGPVPYGLGPFIKPFWKNILSQICSRIIFGMHTALRACSKHAHDTPEAVCTQIMLLDHIFD